MGRSKALREPITFVIARFRLSGRARGPSIPRKCADGGGGDAIAQGGQRAGWTTIHGDESCMYEGYTMRRMHHAMRVQLAKIT
jgi:hypothetical protein